MISSATSLGFTEFLCLAPFHELSTQLSLVLHLKSPCAGTQHRFSSTLSLSADSQSAVFTWELPPFPPLFVA